MRVLVCAAPGLVLVYCITSAFGTQLDVTSDFGGLLCVPCN